ncbi:MAG: DUF4058 family protein [Chloroflexi bacterium]|nr:DUF4058 family protein [Chloroflexota bacterium]
MPSPFPGMDPYLENPGLWPGVHNWLIATLGEDLSPLLLPRYYVALEERVYIAEPERLDLVGRPDVVVVPANVESQLPSGGQMPGGLASSQNASGIQVLTAEVPMPDEVRETYLEIHEAVSGEVVTVVEILSPTDKRPGEGRRVYEAKRLQTLGTRTHLVEIDLLRSGEPLPLWPRDWPQDHPLSGDYRIAIARGDRRPLADVFAFTVRNAIPVFALPLRRGDDEPQVDLSTSLQKVFDRGGYALRIDCRSEPVPPLRPEDAAWADALLRSRGLR